MNQILSLFIFIFFIFLVQLLNTPGEWDRAPKSGQFMMSVKQQLLINIGNTPGFHYSRMEKQKILDKIGYGRQTLRLLDKFHPGYNYKRGRKSPSLYVMETRRTIFTDSFPAGILYECHAAGQELLQHLSEEERPGQLEELCKWREEMLEICKVEQPGSPYFQLAEMMKALQQQQ